MNIFICVLIFLSISNSEAISNTVQKLVAGWHKNKNFLALDLAIVFDKEFGDIFQHNRTRILEYWALFMRDLRWRIWSLSYPILLHVTSVTVLDSAKEQPFIENVRNQYGLVDLREVIPRFADWVGSRKETFPKFDSAMAVIAAKLTGRSIGVAYLRNACADLYNVALVGDKGLWNVETAAHELGHLLGAHHDSGVTNCTETGYIMGHDRAGLKRYLFSNCSDHLVSKFVQSKAADCLRKNYGSEKASLLPRNVPVPEMSAQCKMRFNISNAQALENSTCQVIKCVSGKNGSSRSIKFIMMTLDGSPCKVGRRKGSCFRGTCLPWTFGLEIELQTNETIMCLEFQQQQNVSAIKPCSLIFYKYFGVGFIVENLPLQKTKLIAIPYTIVSEGDIRNGVGCFGIINNQIPVILFPCSEKVPPEFRWIFDNMNQEKNFLKTGASNTTGGYYISHSEKFVIYQTPLKSVEFQENIIFRLVCVILIFTLILVGIALCLQSLCGSKNKL